MSYLIFARKYRPQTFEDMIGQKSVVQTLQNAIRTHRITQAYLFSGMRGVGKTTAARILAKALNCRKGPTPTPCNACEACEAIGNDRSIDVIEIDGASNRGIDDIKTLRESVKYKPLQNRYKVIIIDEVHQLSRDAFNALLKTLEEPPPNTVFIFATTEFHKVPATIVSRCQHFEFKKISHKEIINHLMDISVKEGITISPLGLGLIAEAAEGSLRDAQSLLDQAVAFSGENVGDEDLREILGAISRDILFDASSAVLEGKADAVFSLVDRLVEGGYDLRSFFKELIEHFRNLLLARSMEKPEDLLFLNADEMERLKAEAGKSSAEDLLRYLIALQQGESGLRYSSHPRIFLETLLVKLCRFRDLVPLADILIEMGGAGSNSGPAPESGNKPSQARNESGKRSPTAPAGPALQRPSSSSRPAPGMSQQPAPGTSAAESSSSKTAPVASASVSPDANSLFAAVLGRLQQEKAALAAVLAQYSSVKIKDGTLEICFPGGKGFYIETIRKDTKAIEKTASDIFGEKVALRLAEEILAEEKPEDQGMETALKDPTVRFFMDTFKAQVLSVDPVKKPKGSD